MNLYVRYFQEEALVRSLDEAIDFLSAIPEIVVTNELIADLQDYWESKNTYPQRYKVRPRVYFIMIKTIADTIEEFKANNKQNRLQDDDNTPASKPILSRKEIKSGLLNSYTYGWYEGTIIFKRVTPITGTNKFEYKDTRFSAFVRTNSAIECYERIVEHLRSRQDVDSRSQYPSAKGNNFSFKYMGETLPEDFVIVGD